MPRLDEIKEKIFSRDKSTYPAQKMVAAIAYLGKTYWIGSNNYKSHPTMQRTFENGSEKSCCHAEVSALMKVPRQSRSKVKLYVIRFLRDGSVSMAKPCDMCCQYLVLNKVDFRNVYYSNWDWDGEWRRLADEKNL